MVSWCVILPYHHRMDKAAKSCLEGLFVNLAFVVFFKQKLHQWLTNSHRLQLGFNHHHSHLTEHSVYLYSQIFHVTENSIRFISSHVSYLPHQRHLSLFNISNCVWICSVMGTALKTGSPWTVAGNSIWKDDCISGWIIRSYKMHLSL